MTQSISQSMTQSIFRLKNVTGSSFFCRKHFFAAFISQRILVISASNKPKAAINVHDVHAVHNCTGVIKQI
jgi:hypothetical protein